MQMLSPLRNRLVGNMAYSGTILRTKIWIVSKSILQIGQIGKNFLFRALDVANNLLVLVKYSLYWGAT